MRSTRSATAPASASGRRNSACAARSSPASQNGSEASGIIAAMNEPASSLSIVDLFLHADIVVKGVLLLLLAGSIWSWAVIIEKLRQLGLARRGALGYEARAATARTAA